jgi:predicted transglutaminase-like cysteine proteinase
MIAQNIALQSWTWKALNKINREVNAAIEPISNLEHWGTIADHWDYPTDGKGDCKIYALQERKLLIEQGFPRQALLMTIVKDQNDEGHAVLTVVTSLGDFILDNMTNEIRPWEKTAYRFLKRQSQEDPNIWVAIEPPKKQRLLSLR